MSLTLRKLSTAYSLAEIHERLGGIPLDRIRYHPLPGTAQESDLLVSEHPCELVDGTLLEKPLGFYESTIAAVIIELIGAYVRRQGLGVVLAPDAPVRLLAGCVRMPDVSFVSRRHFPDRRLPGSILGVAPDLAVEVLSPGNTKAEMALKREEYFEAGSRLVWEVDPESRSVRAYSAPDECTVLGPGDSLSGGDVLPGFDLPVASLFPPRAEAADRPD